MNVLSLFTGVGGFDLGLERAGHTIVGQVEWDKKCQVILRKHWPEVPLWDDVSTFDAEWLRGVGIFRRDGGEGRGYWVSEGRDTNDKDNGERGKCDSDRVDLVCGGFPCQDLSVAGRRAGLAGERSGLFHEAVRIADAVLEPGGWVLIENVPGLLSSNGGRDFGIVLASLAERGFYDLAWRVLDSRFFGVPQRRRRVFILGRRASGRRAAQVLLDPEGGSGNHQASRETRQGAAATFGVGVAGTLGSLSGGFRTTDLDGQGNGALVSDGCLRESASGSQGDAVLPATDDRRRKTGAGIPDGQDRAISPPPDTDGVRTPTRIPRRVDDPVTAFHATQTPIHSTDHAPALGSSAQIGVMGSGGTDTACPYDPKPDGPRYAQMGNAVTVPVAEWIGERLRDFG